MKSKMVRCSRAGTLQLRIFRSHGVSMRLGRNAEVLGEGADDVFCTNKRFIKKAFSVGAKRTVLHSPCHGWWRRACSR